MIGFAINEMESRKSLSIIVLEIRHSKSYQNACCHLLVTIFPSLQLCISLNKATIFHTMQYPETTCHGQFIKEKQAMFCQEYQIHKVLNMATHKKCLAASQWRAFLRAYRNNNVDRILRFSFSAIS